MKKSQLLTQVYLAVDHLESNSSKRAFVWYSGHVQCLRVTIIPSKENYTETIMEKTIFLANASEAQILDWFNDFTKDLESVSALPDGPNEPMITVRLPISRAKQLGVA